MKYLLCLSLILLSNVCFASDGWEALIGIGVIQVLLFFWSFIAPFFFMPSSKKRFAHYLVFVIVIYGVIGLVGAPFSLLLQAGVWFNSSFYGWGYTLATQMIAFCLSIYALKKYSTLCIKAVDDFYSEK